MSSVFAVWSTAGSHSAIELRCAVETSHFAHPLARSFFWQSSSSPDPNPGLIALGGSLLPLLPEDRFDHQPLWSADGSCCLVADVRLDNRADLARKLHLSNPGQLADAQILLAAWLRWGESCLDHLVGGFAFAVWTPGRPQLFAARDHAGERPLCYHQRPDFFALASQPKGLLCLPGVDQGIDEEMLASTLVLVDTEPSRSLFRGIRLLPPGHCLRFTPGSLTTRSYWHPSDTPPLRLRRDEDYAEALTEILDQAIEARLRSVKPVASQLSAGLDSGAVTASAALLLAARGERLTAFTSIPHPDFHPTGHPGRILNEWPGAQDVARLNPNLDHLPVYTQGKELLADLQAWSDALNEPPRNVTNLLWYSRTLELARERGSGVLLQGTAGNATLSFEYGGMLRHLLRRGHWLRVFRTASTLRNNGAMSFRAAFRHTSGRFPSSSAPVDLTFTPIHPELLRKYDLLPRLADRLRSDHLDLPAYRRRFFDIGDDGLVNAAVRDRFGIDLRDPTNDKRLWEFSYAIPPEQHVAGHHFRSLIRRAMRDRLPRATLLRHKRGMQSSDWPHTLNSARPALLAELERIESFGPAQCLLDLPRLRHLLTEWPATGFDTPDIIASRHFALTRGIATGYFLRSHPTPPALP